MKKSWDKPQEHPVNVLPEKTCDIVRDFFDTIPTQSPTELFRLQTERIESMVYVSQGQLNDLVWELAKQLTRKKKFLFF